MASGESPAPDGELTLYHNAGRRTNNSPLLRPYIKILPLSARASPNDETIKCRGAVRLRDPSFRLAWWAGSVLEGPHEGVAAVFSSRSRKDIDVLCMEPFDGFNRDVKMPRMARLPSLCGHTDAVMDAIVLDQPREVYIPSSRKEMSREVGLLATCSLDKTIRLWHLPSCKGGLVPHRTYFWSAFIKLRQAPIFT